MNAEDRIALIRQSILKTLSDCGNYLLPEETLLLQLNITVIPPMLRSELEEQLRWLDSNRFIVAVRSDLGGAVKWKLTANGRAVLAS